MTGKYFFILVLGLVTSVVVMGQQINRYDLFKLAEDKKLAVFNREVKTFTENGKQGISFSSAKNDGVAWIDGLTFSNGIIELDIKGRDVLQESFVGVAFHGIDETKFDAIYFRPFNFRTSDSVRNIHAVQYICLPDYDWKRLREEHNGKYEKAISPAPSPDEWFHAKIIVDFPVISVYVNGSKEPSLTIEKLNTIQSGKLGLWVGNNSDGKFCNLTIQITK